ncbi:hypothetical protein OE749_17365 [Aestuariibacter sp. AA17]|uniref:DUF2262 domain-containing protein n=1 Tax=Fluctibacter corallii TaxID=2984329 RepID=A0ABT3ACV1_9ALTE|nr:hypothetical protein [Aestuariibacter sp. AA17]MCV2886468.1 hypothetical protein [Aestuariibacter sp. AA17]
MANSQKLKEALQNLVGLECSNCVWGEGAGSAVKFSFTINDDLQKEKSWQESELRNELMVYCAWRLVSNSLGTFSWRDIGIRDDALAKALESLLTQRIVEVDYDSESHDFNIIFENNTTLCVFCDISNDYESDENYIFFGNSEILYVDCFGEFQTEQYDKR